MNMDHKEQQLQTIQGWVDSGESRVRTIMRVCETYDLSYPQAAALVTEAIKVVSGTLAQIDRPEFLAQQMSRLEALAVKAQESGNLAVTLNCYKELHMLAKLHAS
jgi:flagellar basal body rod protein FlgB